ncbi:MAG: CBS domain-containing protein [Thermococcus sp.]|uniref:Inosine-5`-monophosphate dehydrogenase n=1 Tax=Thermococcus guaymasensis DSM 11113 TaxID=1432656 RepID=A0A0X1KKW1_9EURY|nr:CBS domain-containing protein [Thermococcus guaymasensis]AJC71896.1 inosine-5`-monophosphate dehydrogenase [Thermococcus guaymasensis DSM 11113]MCD6524211.1 CBS domain-containing protein [Thermococcus sp.]
MDMKAPIRVYMTRKLIGVRPKDTVKRAGEIMTEFDIGSLVVVDDNNNVVGFLTKGDIIRRLVVPGLPNTTPVKDIMTKDLVTVPADTPLRDVLDVMAKKGVKHILIEENGKIVGIFSITDLLEASRRRLETAIATE